MGKCNLGLRVIYNFIILSLKSFLSFGSIKIIPLQLISPKAKIITKKFGQIVIDKRCCIEEGTLIKASSGKIILEKNIYINRNCTIVSHEKIIIKEGTTIGPNVCIYDHDHNYKMETNTLQLYISKKIVIGKNVWIGAGVIILKGVSIGDNCVIGAGVTLIKDIPSNSIVTFNNQLIIRKK